MSDWVITLSGASSSRIEEFSHEISKQIGEDLLEPIAISSFLLKPNADIYDAGSYDAKKISEVVSKKTEARVSLFYGPVASSIIPKEVAQRIDLFIDTDPLDLAILEVERSLSMLEGLETAESDANETKKSIEEATTSFEEQLKNSVLPQKASADIQIHHSESVKDSVPGLARYIKRQVVAEPKEATHQTEQVDEMLARFSKGGKVKRSYAFKRIVWRGVVKSTLFLKRLIDIIATMSALLLLSPLFLIVGLIIKLTDSGKVFYYQQRVGKQGKIFSFPKFRSMVVNADKMKDQLLQQSEREGDITFKMKKDPRVTAIGRFIRRFSIDELPQLWCVIKGDMSLVGPRPPLPREVALYTQEDRRRLEVIPGLTGIWQVSGRADIGFEDQVKLDVLYIESHSIWLDIKLLFLTVPAVLTGRGAY